MAFPMIALSWSTLPMLIAGVSIELLTLKLCRSPVALRFFTKEKPLDVSEATDGGATMSVRVALSSISIILFKEILSKSCFVSVGREKFICK